VSEEKVVEENASAKGLIVEPRRVFRRRMLLVVIIGAWCVLTWWLSVLPREEVRAWETAIIRNQYARQYFSRETLNWRPPGFSLMGHVLFYIPFGIGVVAVGRVWGRRAMLWAGGGAFVWGLVSETSQFLSEDRTPRVLDLLASWTGVVVGMGVAVGWLGLLAWRRRWRRPQPNRDQEGTG
jgi:VanZ family protein